MMPKTDKVEEIDKNFKTKISDLLVRKNSLFLRYRKRLEEEKMRDLRSKIKNSK